MDTVIDKAIEILKREPSLLNVRNWHKVNGLIPGNQRTVSIGCDDENFDEYTKALDEGLAHIKVYASLSSRELPVAGRRADEDRLEYGEREIRIFAKNIRQCLTANLTLDGVVDSSFVKKIEYVTADGHEDLHIAVLSFEVTCFVDRRPPYRSFTMAIVMTGPGTVTPLPITPVVAIVNIPGYLPGVDYRLADDGSGVQWLAGHGPVAGSAIPVTWQFAADNEAIQVGKIVLDNNGEITEIS